MKTYTKDEILEIGKQVFDAEYKKYRDFNPRYFWEKFVERLN